MIKKLFKKHKKKKIAAIVFAVAPGLRLKECVPPEPSIRGGGRAGDRAGGSSARPRR